MNSIHRRPLGALFLTAACLATAAAQDKAEPASQGPLRSGLRRLVDVDAWTGPGVWRLGVAPFSHHYRYSAEHRYVWAVAGEWQTPDDWLAGASYFRNSFGQPSAYLYAGKRFPGLLEQPALFAQVSAGLLYGYRGQYQRKVPLNYNGFSPGALVSMGWQFDKTSSVTLHLLGDAGFMVQLAYDFR